ncbi:MAG: bifunctional nicotinamidase/pyrazinamidase [Hyphomicrobiales bacterium]|nr:bifunctional nicotinamidase/pyrazinamidase [Hyphomicrobiales bacterium]
MPTARDCLIVVDVQNDFLPGGALAVPRGDEIVPLVGPLAARFETVVLTQDWHPASHVSFATNHPGRPPFETIDLAYGPQVLWPAHCVQATPGAALADGLDVPHAVVILRKGANAEVDSYSAFREADRTTDTGLAALLKARGIERVFVCGLATDFCVAWTAEDAAAAGFATVVVEDVCRAIDLDGSLAAARATMAAAGVVFTTADRIA